MQKKSQDELKKQAAKAAVAYVKPGMTVGLGTGSTAAWFIRFLGNKIDENFPIRGIPTSIEAEKLAREAGIQLTGFDRIEMLDITVDGADEANGDFCLIKGGGGALLREKITARNSRRYCIIIDDSKMVDTLGAFPLPVEAALFGWQATARQIRNLGAEVEPRIDKDDFFKTDNGNMILDCRFRSIPDAAELERRLNLIPGVIECGLFVDMADLLIIAGKDGIKTLNKRGK